MYFHASGILADIPNNLEAVEVAISSGFASIMVQFRSTIVNTLEHPRYQY